MTAHPERARNGGWPPRASWWRGVLVAGAVFPAAAISLTACGGARSPSQVGPAQSPVASSLNRCPVPVPLPFDPRAKANAEATARRALPLVSKGIVTTGFEITGSNPAASSAAGARGGLVGNTCGQRTQKRTYVVELEFPAMLPSAALSQVTLFVSRFAVGWQVWAEYPPGPEPRTSVTSPTTSTTAVPGSTVDSIPPTQATRPIYLALGDSAPIWDGNASYPNYIAAHYRSSVKGLELVNLSVSGET
jgi:hypothetical protein